jgi:hypothetical protein
MSGEWLLAGNNGFLTPLDGPRNFCSPRRAIFAHQALARRMGGPGRQFIHEKYAEIFIWAMP